jgi:hypothetical protein
MRVISQSISFVLVVLSSHPTIVRRVPEENKETVVGNISTFGDYMVNSDGSINLEIVGSSFPNWDDTKQKHLVEIKDDEMKWTDPKASTGGSAVITLQRAKSGDRYPQRDEK